MLVTIANGIKLHHANRAVTLKFTLAGIQHQETFLVAPLGSNQMILGMPWLERVNPLIDWKLRTLIYRTSVIPRVFNRPHTPNIAPHHDADPAPPCPPSIEPSYPSSDDAHRPQPVPVEHEPCSKSIIQEPIPQSTPQPMSVEDESCSESSPQSITPSTSSEPQPRRKKTCVPTPCITVPYRRPNPRPRNSPPISMTRRIRKGDLVALVFLNLLSEAEINSVDTNSDSSKDPPEIPECYRDLADVFSKKEATSLPPHRGHLDHHIPLMDDAKPVFGPHLQSFGKRTQGS